MRFNQVTPPLSSSPRFLEELIAMLKGILGNLAAIFDKGINLDNTDSKTITYTSNGSANTEDAVVHDLGRVPIGYIVASVNKAGIVYASGTAWTSTLIYVKASAAAVAVKLIVF